MNEARLTESQKRALAGETFPCLCDYNGPQWRGACRCAHCGGILPPERRVPETDAYRHRPAERAKARQNEADAARRDTLRTVRAIDEARAQGRYRDAETIAARWHARHARRLQAAALRRTREESARIARLPLDERIGRTH